MEIIGVQLQKKHSEKNYRLLLRSPQARGKPFTSLGVFLCGLLQELVGFRNLKSIDEHGERSRSQRCH